MCLRVAGGLLPLEGVAGISASYGAWLHPCVVPGRAGTPVLSACVGSDSRQHQPSLVKLHGAMRLV